VPTKAQYQYILVRGDLSPGLQVAQACHAALDFAISHPDKARKWRDTSNYLCILAVRDEAELLNYATLAWTKQAKHALFHDPDVPSLNEEANTVGSYTALAIEPGDFHRHLSSLPLALRDLDREVAMT
jgi:peptidyl-tRNA hydrolase